MYIDRYLYAQVNIKPKKIVLVIKDKQSVMYMQLLKNDYDTHDAVLNKLDKKNRY